MIAVDKETLLAVHRPRWTTFRLWLLFSAVLAAAQYWIVWSVLTERYLSALLGVIITAHFMHSQLMAFHEAAHFVFCPNRRLNEAVGILIGLFHFNSLSLFRAVHHTHHAYLGTPQDEQLWPFVDVRVPRWQRRLAAFAELTFGMFYDAAMFWRAYFRRTTPIRAAYARRRIRQEFALLVVVWSILFGVTAALGTGRILLWMYFAPALLTGSMYAWRKYVEHMGLTGSSPAGLSRTVIHTDPLGRLLTFTMFNIGFHGVHHAYASLPQDALPKFTDVLGEQNTEAEAIFPNYYTALRAMLPSLADPKVGPQWRQNSPA